MSYRWHLAAGTHDMDDLRSQDLLPEFGNRLEAEDWLELYRSDLLEAGVTRVALQDDGRQIQPSMSLSS